jgi:hypothetical protein
MQGRGFLAVAQDVAPGPTDFHRRAAVVHAYYALVLECRDTLVRWGFIAPRRDSMHAWVRLRFAYAADAVLKQIGAVLDTLVRLRNQASYDLLTPQLSSIAVGQDAIREATDALALLDQIDQDATRRTAAIAAIKP